MASANRVKIGLKCSECNDINYSFYEYAQEINNGVFKDSDVRKE